jgi:hypothetical protein
LPVYLGGVAAIKTQGSGWFRSGRISVRVGKMIEPAEAGDPSELTRKLEQAVRELEKSSS